MKTHFPVQLTLPRRWRPFLPLLTLLAISDLMVITPTVWAQSTGSLSGLQALALGLLGLGTLGLSVYLFVVIFQPERF